MKPPLLAWRLKAGDLQQKVISPCAPSGLCLMGGGGGEAA